MPPVMRSLLPFAFGLSSLIWPTIAAPQGGHKGGKGEHSDGPPASYPSDPFSSENWPVPHKITGDNVTDDTGNWHGGHGGIHLHDPSLVLGPDGHYYSFSTHGLGVTSRASKKNSIDGYWEIIGQVLTAPGSIDDPARESRLWAPDVSKKGDTYYCYYTVSAFGVSESFIGLATSKTLQNGSWTDYGTVISSNGTDLPSPLNITNTIDAALLHDPKTETSYLTYGSWWANIWQYILAPDMQSVEPDSAVQLSYTFDPVLPTKEQAYANLSLAWGGASAEEGSYLSYNEKQGYYYLWYSAGLCCGYDPDALPPPGDEYTIHVGRSESPRGPFVDREGVDLAEGGGSVVYGSHGNVYGPGGGGVLSNYHGQDVLYYHYVDTAFDPTYNDLLKFLGWNYIKYIDGWPVVTDD